MDKKQQTIKEIFGESERENIIVKELWLFCSYIFDLFFFHFFEDKIVFDSFPRKNDSIKNKNIWNLKLKLNFWVYVVYFLFWRRNFFT